MPGQGRAATGSLPVSPRAYVSPNPSSQRVPVSGRRADRLAARDARVAAKQREVDLRQMERERAATSKREAKQHAIQVKEEEKRQEAERRAEARAQRREVRRLRRRKAFIVVGVGLVVLVAAGSLVYPSARQYYQTRRAADRLEAQAAAVQARNDQLQANIDSLNTDQGIEDQARSLGWVKDGENAVNVGNAGDITATTSIPDEVELDQIQAPDTWYTVILDPLFGVD